MNLKKAAYYCFIMLLIASGQLFSSCSKENKTPQNNVASGREKRDYEKIKLSFKEFMQYCDLVITADSAGIYVQRGDSILYKHVMPKGYYANYVEYDRLTGNISYNQCTTTGCEKDWWKYELKMWDFKHDKEWTFKKGKSIDGESLDIPIIINFNEKENTAIITTYGWESVQPAYYKNGEEHEFDFKAESIKIQAILPDNEFIVTMSSEGEYAGPDYALYSLKSNKYTEISKTEFMKYNDLALKQFGYNLEVPYIIKLDLSHYNWNPQGTVFVAEHSMSAQASEFWFCNKDLTKKYLLQTDKTTFIPIWK